MFPWTLWGQGQSLQRAVSLGFTEPPPPACGAEGGVGQRQEVMLWSSQTGPRQGLGLGEGEGVWAGPAVSWLPLAFSTPWPPSLSFF